MNTEPVDTSTVDALDADTTAEVHELAAESETADGTSPLDDQVRLDLGHGTAAQRVHVLARRDERLVGYAHVDLRAPSSASAHLVVRPSDRRTGVGRALLDDVVTIAGPRALRAWAHGDGADAAAFAGRLGWARARELRQLRLSRDVALPEAAFPDSVSVRTFEPGRDEDAWVAVNAAAFEQHAEQGRMTADDLRQREEQPWFDPAGFFLAERDGELLGFHWTKVHAHADDPGGPVGEVYVVGVGPRAQGLGLGKALTLIGLHYLRDQGLDVVLYVDADNTAAIALYDRLGFTIAKVDVMYAPEGLAQPPAEGGAHGSTGD